MKKTMLCVVALAALALGPADTVLARGPKPVREQFQVYGGQCLRSWRLLGTYENVGAAFQSAADYRAKKFTIAVTTGKADGAFGSGSPCSYSVYSRDCKSWNLRGTAGSFWKVAVLAEVARRQRNAVEFVYHGDPK